MYDNRDKTKLAAAVRIRDVTAMSTQEQQALQALIDHCNLDAQYCQPVNNNSAANKADHCRSKQKGSCHRRRLRRPASTGQIRTLGSWATIPRSCSSSLSRTSKTVSRFEHAFSGNPCVIGPGGHSESCK